MNTKTPFAAALLFFGMLGACQTTTNPGNPDAGAPQPSPVAAQNVAQTQVPLDAIALRDRVLAAHPDRTEFALLKGGRGGFVLHQNGEVTYKAFKSTSGLREHTRIISNENNRICVAPVRKWSGACLSLFQAPDGTVRVEYEFGNGHGGSYIADGVTL